MDLDLDKIEWLVYKCPNCKLEFFFNKEYYKEIPKELVQCPQCDYPRKIENESRSRF